MRWSEIVRTWGTTPAERARPFPCDAVLPDQDDAWYRAVTIAAEPAVVFRWLCQLRAAPYSYDWIDNFGRQSPRQLTPGLDALELGQRFMSGFDLVDFEQDVHVTLRARGPKWFPSLAVTYRIEHGQEAGCRLVVKLALRLGPGVLGTFVRWVGPGLDWVMMRRQLLNLKVLAEGRT